jgi:hypothetical protein
MKGPDFIPAEGARRALVWTRLKAAAEVGVTKPPIDWPPRWVWSLEEQALKVAASEKPVIPAGDDGWPAPSVFSFGELRRLKAEAERILEAHCFPIADPLPVWRWLDGRGLCWAPRPEESGWIEGEHDIDGEHDELGYIDEASIEAWSRAEALEQWPSSSAFAWARNIFAEARYLEIAEDRLTDLGASSRLVEMVYAHGFRVGQLTALGAVPTYPVPLEVVLKKQDVAARQSESAHKTNAAFEEERAILTRHLARVADELYLAGPEPLSGWSLIELASMVYSESRPPLRPEGWQEMTPEKRKAWLKRNTIKIETIADHLQKAITGQSGLETPWSFAHLPRSSRSRR